MNFDLDCFSICSYSFIVMDMLDFRLSFNCFILFKNISELISLNEFKCSS